MKLYFCVVQSPILQRRGCQKQAVSCNLQQLPKSRNDTTHEDHRVWWPQEEACTQPRRLLLLHLLSTV